MWLVKEDPFLVGFPLNKIVLMSDLRVKYSKKWTEKEFL